MEVITSQKFFKDAACRIPNRGLLFVNASSGLSPVSISPTANLQDYSPLIDFAWYLQNEQDQLRCHKYSDWHAAAQLKFFKN